MSASTEHALLHEAAEWFAILRDEQVSEADRQGWQQWLAASPAHAAAWKRVEAISQPFTRINRHSPHGAAYQALARSPASRRQTLRLLGLGGMLLGSGLLLRHTLPWQSWSQAYAFARAEYRTAIGDQKQLVLDDGSRLSINTASAVDLDFQPNLRRIILHESEILIETAPDPQSPHRPLVVDTRLGRLTALGTRFNVLSDAQGIQFAVFEGVVRIAPTSGQPSVDVAAGQQASINVDQIEAGGPADTAREQWARGQLIADNVPLARFIDELQRYTPVHLGIDTDAGRHRLLGVYRIAEPARDVPLILAAIESTLPVRVHTTNDNTIRITRR